MTKTIKTLALASTDATPAVRFAKGPWQGPDKALLANAKAIVATMTRGEAAERTAMQAAHDRAGLSTKQSVLKMLGGRNSAVTEVEWKRTFAPAFTAALNEAYPDGYGPRLSHIRVMLIGISNGIDGPAGRRQYYEATLPTLYDRGLLARGKAGRPASTVGGAVTSGAPAKAAGAGAGAVQEVKSDGPALPAFAPGKKYSQGELRQAALMLFGSVEFADKLLKVRADAGMTDQLKKAVNSIIAG